MRRWLCRLTFELSRPRRPQAVARRLERMVRRHFSSSYRRRVAALFAIAAL